MKLDLKIGYIKEISLFGYLRSTYKDKCKLEWTIKLNLYARYDFSCPLESIISPFNEIKSFSITAIEKIFLRWER